MKREGKGKCEERRESESEGNKRGESESMIEREQASERVDPRGAWKHVRGSMRQPARSAAAGLFPVQASCTSSCFAQARVKRGRAGGGGVKQDCSCCCKNSREEAIGCDKKRMRSSVGTA
jgi:hypothetical protein